MTKTAPKKFQVDQIKRVPGDALRAVRGGGRSDDVALVIGTGQSKFIY